MAAVKHARPMTGERFRRWRELWQMSQTELADELGCSRRAIYNWENDVTDVPQYIALAMAAVCERLKPLE